MKKDELLVKFGNRLRQLRIERGLSQEKLAELADVHRTYIGMLERADKNVTIKNIEKIAKGLKIEMYKLIKF